MISCEQANKIKAAFQKGSLRVQSVSSQGSVEWKKVEATHKNSVPWEYIYEHQTEFGPMVTTGGHSVYVNPETTVLSSTVVEGSTVLSVCEEETSTHTILAVQRLPNREFMYDLTVEDHPNFVLHRSKVVVHNRPDKHYHFCPPEHEAQIGQMNRVFGFVWEDLELLHYLRMALDEWNTFPPNTASMVCSLTHMLGTPFTASWRGAIMWGAIVWAMFALARNWLHDEFSIGGEVPVKVVLPDGREVSLPVEELYEVCHGD